MLDFSSEVLRLFLMCILMHIEVYLVSELSKQTVVRILKWLSCVNVELVVVVSNSCEYWGFTVYKYIKKTLYRFIPLLPKVATNYSLAENM